MDLQRIAEPVGEICNTVRNELEKINEHHSCIFASAVLTKVLQRKGYTGAYPLTLRAKILNPALATWVKQHGFPNDPASHARCKAAGAAVISVGVNMGNVRAGSWAGHLAVILPKLFGDQHALLDVTITQACKAHLGVEFPPFMLRVPETFLKGQTEFKAQPGGSLVVYMAFPDDESYKQFGHWTNTGRCDEVVERIVTPLE